MANQKITDLTAISTLAAEDLFEVVDDPSGTPSSRKATVSQVLSLSSLGLIYTVDPAVAIGFKAFWSASRTWYGRVFGGGTISKVGIDVGASSGNICVAAYRNSGTGRSAVPGTRLATSGSVACPAIGYAEVSLGASVDLEPGDWLSLGCDNVTATFLAMNDLARISNFQAGRATVQTTYPAPSSPSPTAGSFRNFALLGIA